MGESVENKKSGGDFSCWRIFDVSKSSALGDLGTESSEAEVLIAPPQEMVFMERAQGSCTRAPGKPEAATTGTRME
jgi:hypothetical protein